MIQWKKAGLGLLTAASILLLVELFLRLFPDLKIDPLPIPESGEILCNTGTGISRLCQEERLEYERVRPEVFFDIPDKPRIIVIGESFVHGYTLSKQQAWPYKLQNKLTDVEVLNFGRCGSYSTRLLPVVEAATKLKPDLVILSMGNNEHTMTTFYTGKAAKHPLTIYKLSSTLGHFRTYGLLYKIFGGGVVHEASESNLTFEDPLEQKLYAARRRPPQLDIFEGGIAPRTVTKALEEEQRLKELIFQDRLEQMIKILKKEKINVIITTLPRGLMAAPNLTGVYQGISEQRTRDLVSTSGEGTHIDFLRVAASEAPKAAILQWAYGMALLQQNDKPNAIKYLRQAVEWDLVPDATPSINAIIKKVAEKEKIPLVDLDQLSEEYVDQPGEIFLDVVHVNENGAEIVAEKLIPTVEKVLHQ